MYRILACLSRPPDDLVIDVSEISHIVHLISKVLQKAEEHIKSAVHSGMAWVHSNAPIS